MPIIKEGHFITKAAEVRFRKWLVEKNLTVNKFSKLCGCSRQYLEQVLAGKKKITHNVRLRFEKGGYTYL